MDNAGAIIGPLIAALLVGIGISLQNIFLLALAPAILAVSLSLMIKEKNLNLLKIKKLNGHFKECQKFLKSIYGLLPFLH